MNSMNQQFHAVVKKGKLTMRVPWSPGQKYDSKKLIHPRHEVHQFLEKLGVFAMASIDDPDKATQLLDYGFYNEETKQLWHACGYYVRDTGTVFVLLPEHISDAEFAKRLGLRIEIPQPSDTFKVGKYLKRLWSHHRKYIEGDVIEEHDDWIMVKLDNGKVITVRYAPQSPLTEGMNLISTRTLKMLGYRAQHGSGLRVTALSTRGFTKGHAIALEQLHFDMVMYETKPLLKSDGRFVFALDELHSGKLFTDCQSAMNYQQGAFLEPFAETYMRQVSDAFADEEKLRNMLRFYDFGFHKNEHDTDEQERGEYIWKEKDWSLQRAMRAGLPISQIPGLLRRSYNLFTNNVMQCEGNIRIPVQPEVGGARYILVDPTIFDMWGNPSLNGVLVGNQVYCPKHVGAVVFHRQPNAHRAEHHIAESVHHPEHVAMDTGCFMFMSRDTIVGALKKLGGGDQDDRVVYYTDLEIVKHFNNLPSYPVVNVVQPAEPEALTNRFLNKLRTPQYDRPAVKAILSQQLKQRVTIGQAVNPIMVDTHISDETANIINYLCAIPDKKAKEINALKWMRERQPYQNRRVASQLESIIDGAKRDGKDSLHVAKEIQKFWTDLKVSPEFMLSGGEFGGRLPKWKKDDPNLVIVRTSIDDVMDKIKQVRIELEDYVNLLSWERVMEMQIPEEVLTYPDTPGDEQLAKAIRGYYLDQISEIMSKADNNRKARVEAFMEVDKNVYDRFKNHPCIIPAMIKLYIMVYSNRRLEVPRDETTGRPKGFPDGVLWGPRMSGLTLQALDAAGSTVRYTDVSFYDDSKKYRRGSFDVVVRDGVVFAGDTREVGMVDPAVVSGNAKMERGLIGVPTHAVIPQPKPKRTEALTVVNGWSSKPEATREVIKAWKDQAASGSIMATLVPYTRKGEDGQEEHAVRVLVDGKEYGHITKQRGECYAITTETVGWLVPARDRMTNTVMVVIEKE